MGKTRKLTKKEQKEMLEMFNSKKGVRMIRFKIGNKFYPFCILCGKIVRSGQFLQALWTEPEFERIYAYAICLDHGDEPLSDKIVMKLIEEKLMLLAASGLPRIKI